LRGIAVSNALDNVRLATGYCLASDVPDIAGDVAAYRLLWTYSKKAVANWIYSTGSARAILEMALVVAGGKEELRRKKLLTYFAEPISPLRWATHSLEIMLLLAEHECPIYLGPMVTVGGSGPVTLAGSLAMHNAEILQGLVAIHACNPRQPVIYSCHAHRLDLSRGTILYGAPEQALLAVGATQLAKRYGMAISGNVMLSDSNCPDYMAGFEAAATATYALAAGWEILGFCGFGTIGVAGSGVGLSLEHAIIQDEALGYLGRMVRSFDVNDDTLAVDLIEQVGIGGNFFAEEHTVRHMRSELWQDRGIFKACDYETWARNGAKTVLDRAHARLEDILATALPLEPILEPGKTHELKRIEDRYSKDFNATSASY
jgi:trimethylamine--corrinoid protein Co-methyltransferase